VSKTADIDLDAPPVEIYSALNRMDDDEFDALMSHTEDRAKVIDVLVEHMAGQFRPEQAKDVDAVIHVKLWDKPGGGYDHRELVIRDGTCHVSAEPGGDADLTLKVRPSDLRGIITGRTGPRRLALRGRLRVLGDLGLGMKLSEYFDLSGNGRS
jgi:putative sterol carrier protein